MDIPTKSMWAATAVLSPAEARKALGGRTPLLPPEYELAVQSLTECTTIDEAKYWSNKADVYSAWAKIYHSDEVMRKAKVLKLHAQRRMGQLAEQLRPTKTGPKAAGQGPVQYLREQGFKRHEADEIRAVARAPKEAFDHEVAKKNPPSARYFKNRQQERNGQVDSKKLLSVYTFAAMCRSITPEGLLAKEGTYYNKALLEAAMTISEWSDRLEQVVRKAKVQKERN